MIERFIGGVDGEQAGLRTHFQLPPMNGFRCELEDVIGMLLEEYKG